MNLSDVRELYTYNDWANDRLILMLNRVFGEEFDLRGTEDTRILSIQETATHIIGAQAIWRSRWEGFSPSSMLDPAEYPTPLALRMAFGAERARFWGYFDTIEGEEALDLVLHSKSTTGEPRIFPLRQMLVHVITHSVYHRGQITSLLLNMGYGDAIISTDLVSFYDEQNQTPFNAS